MFGYLSDNKTERDVSMTLSLISFCIYKTWVIENAENVNLRESDMIRNEMSNRLIMNKYFSQKELIWNTNLIAKILDVL